MRKIILYISFIFTITLSFFYILDRNGIEFNSKRIKKLFNNSFDYLSITNRNNSNLNEYISLEKILDYQYSSIYPIVNTNTSEKPVQEKTEEVIKEEIRPLVYIYNTHNKEEYSKDTSPHSIVPNVVTVSYMIKEELEKNGIVSIVEERKVSDVLNKNKWNYASSYKASREFLESSIINNPTLEYFIDVHRDSVKKSISTVVINEKSYAKIMFVLGLENKNYNENLKLMEYLNNKINSDYPGLSRGIYKKKGKGVNGIYNQDFSKNCILIEFGGNENKIEEVYNSTLVVTKYLTMYIGDKNGNQ